MKHFSAPLRAAGLLLLLAGLPGIVHAQMGVGTASPNARAALDISATDKGLLIPRLTQAQRTAISSPPTGLMVFQTDGTTGFWYYAGGAWVNIPNANTAGDNLGNHTATQNLNLGTNSLTGTLAVNVNRPLNLADQDILLRDANANDLHHGLGYYGPGKPWNGFEPDGPALYGYEGGLLGTNQFGVRASSLYWNRAGQIGIGTTSPATGMRLHVTGTAGTPNVRLASLGGSGTRMVTVDANGDLNTQAVPASIANTAVAFNPSGTLSVTDGTGTQTSTRQAWLLNGNTLTATGSLGTASNNHLDLVTNGVTRGRLSNLGEFFIGATGTTIGGDLMGGVGNATFPFAVNGYTSFNGSGVYGFTQNGSTTFGAVQGEYSSTTTGANTAGMRGVNQATVAGTGYRIQAATGPRVGVVGSTTATAGPYTFGLHGSMGSTDIRAGGVFGDDFGIAMASLGYYAANQVDYAVYGFGNAYQTGGAGGRPAGGAAVSVLDPLPTERTTQIGLGIYGGVMGGWVRGLVYGTHFSGARYGVYVDGQTLTNNVVAQLQETSSGARVATYMAGSLSVDVSARGRADLHDGEAWVPFPAALRAVLSEQDAPVITVTPLGRCPGGLYLADVKADGFRVRAEDGQASVAFNWTVIGTRRGYEQAAVSPEILTKDFDATMRGVMHNDNDPAPGTPIWWDGAAVRHDTPPARRPDPGVLDASRQKVRQ